MKAYLKEITRWYQQLQPRGKILFYAAVVGLVWLLTQLILSIAGVALPSDGPWPIVFFVLNLLAVTLVALIVAQFFLVRRMQKQAREAQMRMIMGGQKHGPRVQQPNIRGRVSRTGKMTQQMSGVRMTGAVSAQDIDQQYRSNPFARATKVADWMDIEEPGVYALTEEPREKIQIIDASDTIGGFFVGKWTGGRLKTREIVCNSRGEPLHFATLRNAKKYLARGEKRKVQRGKSA